MQANCKAHRHHVCERDLDFDGGYALAFTSGLRSQWLGQLRVGFLDMLEMTPLLRRRNSTGWHVCMVRSPIDEHRIVTQQEARGFASRRCRNLTGTQIHKEMKFRVAYILVLKDSDFQRTAVKKRPTQSALSRRCPRSSTAGKNVHILLEGGQSPRPGYMPIMEDEKHENHTIQ